jgi:hypothetical protein
VSEFRFYGRERATIELDGTFRPGGLAIPPRLALELDGDGRARVRLFAFAVEKLRIARVPLVHASYAELLWRVAVTAGATPAWWVVACDLGPRAARWLAGRYVRYPVRARRVDVELDHIRTDGLALAFGAPGGEQAAIETRPLLVGAHAEYEVPWGDDGPPARPAVARVELDTLAAETLAAPVTWAGVAFVRAGREHRCGVAHRPRCAT